MISRTILSSMCPLRNPHLIKVLAYFPPNSWQTSKKDINTKLSVYLPWGKIRANHSLSWSINWVSACPIPLYIKKFFFQIISKTYWITMKIICQHNCTWKIIKRKEKWGKTPKRLNKNLIKITPYDFWHTA